MTPIWYDIRIVRYGDGSCLWHVKGTNGEEHMDSGTLEQLLSALKSVVKP